MKAAAIVDQKKKKGSLAKKFRIESTYCDIQSMLENEKPDVVHIAAPVSFHHKNVIAAMNEGVARMRVPKLIK